MALLSTILGWFTTGRKPSQAEYHATFQSFEHRLEGPLDLTSADPLTFAAAKGGVSNLSGSPRTGTIDVDGTNALLGAKVIVRYQNPTIDIQGAAVVNSASTLSYWLRDEQVVSNHIGLLELRVVNLAPFQIEVVQLDELDALGGAIAFADGNVPVSRMKSGQSVGISARMGDGFPTLEFRKPIRTLTSSVAINLETVGSENIPSGAYIRLNGSSNPIDLTLPSQAQVANLRGCTYTICCLNAVNPCRVLTGDMAFENSSDSPIELPSGGSTLVLTVGRSYEIVCNPDAGRWYVSIVSDRGGLDMATADGRYYTQAQVDQILATELTPLDEAGYELKLDRPGGYRYGSPFSPQTYRDYTLPANAEIHEAGVLEICSQGPSPMNFPPEIQIANPLDWRAWSSTRVNQVFVRIVGTNPVQYEARYAGWLNDPTSASFTPADMVGVVHWWRIHDQVITDGERAVSGIVDAVSGRNMLVTGADTNLAPVWNAATKMLEFTQLQQTHLKATFNTAINGPYTVIQLVPGSELLTTSMATWGNGIADGNPGALMLQGRGGGQSALRIKDEAGTKGLIDYSALTGQVNVITTVVNGAASRVYLNKDLILDNQSISGNLTEMVMGASSAVNGVTSEAATASLGDLIVLDRAISDEDLNAMVDYYTPIYNA